MHESGAAGWVTSRKRWYPHYTWLHVIWGCHPHTELLLAFMPHLFDWYNSNRQTFRLLMGPGSCFYLVVPPISPTMSQWTKVFIMAIYWLKKWHISLRYGPWFHHKVGLCNYMYLLKNLKVWIQIHLHSVVSATPRNALAEHVHMNKVQ